MRVHFVLALVLLAAGCVTPPAEQAPGVVLDVLPFPDPMGQDHDHADPTLHTNAWNFELLDHHPLAGSSTHSAGVHALDHKNGFLFAALYGGDADAEGGFFVFDVSTPEKPKAVGRYQFPGQLGGDRSMEANEDASFVVLGTEAITCAGHVNPLAPGLYLIDVRDKANPTPVDYMPGRGIHSVIVHRIQGEDYVFGLMPEPSVRKIDLTGPKPRLVAVADLPIGHDATVVDDELDEGKTYLYSSNGAAGFEVWDVSDPTKPEKVAAWDIPNRPKGKYYLHTSVVQFIEGRRIAVVTTEDWDDYPSLMFVLDVTDFGFIELLATWNAPGDHAAEGLRYSMHNPRWYGSDLILSYYHGGVWALDLSAPASPRVVGQYMPHESTGYEPEPPKTNAYAERACGAFHWADIPSTVDVESGVGVIYAADLHTGLYTLKPLW